MLRKAAIALLSLSLAACGTGGGSRSEGGDTASKQGEGMSAAEINVSLGQAYLEQGRLELALDKLKKALKLDPKLSSAHTVIAVVYERINDQPQAQFHYKRATELAPKNGPALNNYGTYLCRAKQYEEADKYFARALADPFYQQPATAHANRGSCAMLWGDLDLAEKSLREAVRLQPNSTQALYDMARVLHARKDDFKARAFVQRCESAAGASPELLLLAMQIEQGLANERGVREYRSRLLREFPESSQAQSIANSEASR
jgi:type IV pilus assembly protein PilF